MRRLAAVVAAVGAFLVVPAAASALWSATAGGAAAAPAATLAPPTAVRLAWDPTVHLDWDASASTWASGYRVLRGVTPGALTQLGVDRPTNATVDDSPGAGTHYYAVVAYHQGWSSQRSAVVPRQDRDYVLTGAAPTGGAAGCASTSSTGMRQGHRPAGTGVNTAIGATSFSVCTDAWTAGQVLPAGSTTVSAYVSNTHGTNACPVSLSVGVGAVTLGTASVTIPAGRTASAPTVWSVGTVQHAFATGQRLTVTLTPTEGSGCNNSRLYAASPSYPSKVTLTA